MFCVFRDCVELFPLGNCLWRFLKGSSGRPCGADQRCKQRADLAYHRRKGDLWQMERIVLSRRSNCHTSGAGYVISRIRRDRKTCMPPTAMWIRSSGDTCRKKIRQILSGAGQKENVSKRES